MKGMSEHSPMQALHGGILRPGKPEISSQARLQRTGVCMRLVRTCGMERLLTVHAQQGNAAALGLEFLADRRQAVAKVPLVELHLQHVHDQSRAECIETVSRTGNLPQRQIALTGRAAYLLVQQAVALERRADLLLRHLQVVHRVPAVIIRRRGRFGQPWQMGGVLPSALRAWPYPQGAFFR